MTTREATQVLFAWEEADVKLEYAKEKFALLTELLDEAAADNYERWLLLKDWRIEVKAERDQAEGRAARASAELFEATELQEAKWIELQEAKGVTG